MISRDIQTSGLSKNSESKPKRGAFKEQKNYVARNWRILKQWEHNWKKFCAAKSNSITVTYAMAYYDLGICSSSYLTDGNRERSSLEDGDERVTVETRYEMCNFCIFVWHECSLNKFHFRHWAAFGNVDEANSYIRVKSILSFFLKHTNVVNSKLLINNTLMLERHRADYFRNTGKNLTLRYPITALHRAWPSTWQSLRWKSPAYRFKGFQIVD